MLHSYAIIQNHAELSQSYNTSFLFYLSNNRGHDTKLVVSELTIKWVCKVVVFYGTANLYIRMEDLL